MQKAESDIKSSFVCKSLQKQLETLLLQWYNNNVILWKLGAKPMRTGRGCVDSCGMCKKNQTGAALYSVGSTQGSFPENVRKIFV